MRRRLFTKDCKLQNANCKFAICILQFAIAFSRRLKLAAQFLALSSLIVYVPGHSRAEEPGPPIFSLKLADGQAVTGPLEGIGEDWSIRLGREKPVTASGLNVISLRRDRLSLPGWPPSEQIILANGDRLPGAVRGLNGERLLINANFGKEAELAIPLSAVSMIWMAAPDGVDNARKWQRRLVASRRSRDIVYLRNGDVVEGTLNAIQAKSRDVQIESAKKEVIVPLNKIAVIALNTELVRPLQPKGVHVRLVLDNGCRLTLESAQADRGALRGKTAFGSEVAFGLDHVLAIDWLGGCVVYLSDLKPRAYESHSFLGDAGWRYASDTSVMESALRLGGQLYDKGLGVHTSSRLTYALDANDYVFEALVGMDDTVGKEGSARIGVMVDGRPQKLAWDGKLTSQTGPRLIRLSLSQAMALTLVADFGDFGDVQGCVDWANARLIRRRNQK
jgi:hypothetical protein